jgi:hypothetical protein
MASGSWAAGCHANEDSVVGGPELKNGRVQQIDGLDGQQWMKAACGD